MTLTEQIISILIAAVVTMAPRFIPFLIFDQSKELSPYLEELGKFLPAAIMGVLVIYCYRNISFAEPSKALLEIVAGYSPLEKKYATINLSRNWLLYGVAEFVLMKIRS